MDALNDQLFQWTQKKSLQQCSSPQIASKIDATVAALQTASKAGLSQADLERVIICLEIIESYRPPAAELERLRDTVLSLSLDSEFLYLRCFRNKQQHNTNSKMADKVNRVIEAYKAQPDTPWVVKTFAPRFYEHADSRCVRRLKLEY